MTIEIPIKRISIHPIPNGQGSYNEFYNCPCGKRCIQRTCAPGGLETELVLQSPCTDKYLSRVEVNKRNQTFILTEKE